MVFMKPVVSPPRTWGRCSMRRELARWLALFVLAVPATTLAAEPEKETPDLPRLGLDPAEPQVRSAPPATPFGIPPATSKEYVLGEPLNWLRLMHRFRASQSWAPNFAYALLNDALNREQADRFRSSAAGSSRPAGDRSRTRMRRGPGHPIFADPPVPR